MQMIRAIRSFEVLPAERQAVPLLFGIMGPSGGGKTYSALRVATGMQSVVGGDIVGIDTESRRMLHYADQFTFKHMQFDAPFGSLDYLDAIRQCVYAGAKVVVVDSMSHEHEGKGGVLEQHKLELDRLAGEDERKRNKMNFNAWNVPKIARREMINGILQLNANFIFCFRAKEKLKPLRGELVDMGWMPIAGEELLFEMTANCLLLPKAGGVPTWRSDQIGEKKMMKLPRQFESIFSDEERPLDEDIGRQMAEWAKGGPAEDAMERLKRLDEMLATEALKGVEALKHAWQHRVSREDKITLEASLRTRHKPAAAKVKPPVEQQEAP